MDQIATTAQTLTTAEDIETDRRERRQLRAATLTNTRWIAVFGQSAAVTLVAAVLGFPFPVVSCFVLIAFSALLNIILAWRLPANQRLEPGSVAAVLAFDILQLAALLFLTGGLQNPFSFLLIVPVVISAATLSASLTAGLGVLVGVAASTLVLWHLPLPWHAGEDIEIPFIFVAGMWCAVISTVAFTAFYVFRVADEARELVDALAETELVLQREQHLSALDGLAAAAAHELGTPLATISLVAKEMDRALPNDDPLKEDVVLLRTQADRCREILGRITTLNTSAEAPIAFMTLREMVEDVSAPHREFGVEITAQVLQAEGSEPIFRRNPGILFGLGNIVENAVDFAKGHVDVNLSWSSEAIRIAIVDDGPGFASEQVEKLGEPDLRATRGAMRERKGGSGLGLGIFIAKTLLERSGARVRFANAGQPGKGAEVVVSWRRSSVEARNA